MNADTFLKDLATALDGDDDHHKAALERVREEVVDAHMSGGKAFVKIRGDKVLVISVEEQPT